MNSNARSAFGSFVPIRTDDLCVPPSFYYDDWDWLDAYRHYFDVITPRDLFPDTDTHRYLYRCNIAGVHIVNSPDFDTPISSDSLDAISPYSFMRLCDDTRFHIQRMSAGSTSPSQGCDCIACGRACRRRCVKQ